MAYNNMKKAIREAFDVPEDIQRLSNMAACDLLWGPIGLDDDWEKENYKGFQSACGKIKEYIDTLPFPLWVDVDCDCVMTSEPEGEEVDGEYLEPCWDSIYLIDRRNDLVRLLLNDHLAGYV